MQGVFYSASEAETVELGRQLAGTLAPGSVVAYYGDLGAGKTAFTRGLARGLNCREQVTSPTYTIVNEYLGGKVTFVDAIHYIKGEGIEKKEENFADEVAAQIAGTNK